LDKTELENKAKRYQELDSLRGIASLSVVLFHFTYGYDNGINSISDNKFYFNYGYLGVQLFFLISGFVIFMTLEKTKKSADFIVSRFSRLYPAYWVAIITTVLITIILSVPSQHGIFTLKQVLVNFSMLQFWFKIKDVDGAYWTLAIELTFYAIMWSVFVLKKQKYITWFCLIWLLLSILFSTIEIPFENYIKIILILKYSPLFAGGIIFYLIKSKKPSLFYHILVLLSLGTEYLFLSQQRSDLIVYTIITTYYIVFYLFVYEKLRFLSNKISLFFGAISYTLYLIHENIGIAIIYWLKKIADFQLFYLPLSILIIVALASCITFYIEKPAMLWIRNYYKGRRE
jgi:peptidoglycan/LPS O-acetylase OafA/YrhL